MKIFIVIDNEGVAVRSFTNFKEAYNFKISNNRTDWTIKLIQKKSTERQKAAVKFCENWLDIRFIGDIDNFYEVSNFLSEYLDEAKRTYEELKCEYESYIEELMD